MKPILMTSTDGGKNWDKVDISETMQTTLFTTITLDRNGVIYMSNAVGEIF